MISAFKPSIRSAAIGAGLLLATVGNSLAQSAADTFYSGKTVELIVPYGVGGGNDIVARFLAPLLSKHVPGNPKVQVINKGGANTLTGSNEFARSKPDGLTWFQSGAAASLNLLLDVPDVHYSYDDWVPILGVPGGSVIYVNPETGVTDPGKLLQSKLPLVMGSQGGLNLETFSLKVLELDAKVVAGYESGGAKLIAFQQGEINLNDSSTFAYKKNVEPLVKEGKAVALFTYGFPDATGKFGRDPAFPDVPHLGEAYEMAHGKPPEGVVWEAFKVLVNANATLQKILWVDKDVPPAAIEALKKGVENVMKDPEYLKGVETALGGYDVQVGDAIVPIAKSMTNPDPEVVKWLREYNKSLN